MATIYSAPKEVKLPEYDWSKARDWEEKDNKYKEELKAHINNLGYTEKETGECIRIPTADSYAEYMVLGLKGGVKLIHLELGDAWRNEMAELLTAKKVKEMIAREKKLANIFGKM